MFVRGLYCCKQKYVFICSFIGISHRIFIFHISIEAVSNRSGLPGSNRVWLYENKILTTYTLFLHSFNFIDFRMFNRLKLLAWYTLYKCGLLPQNFMIDGNIYSINFINSLMNHQFLEFVKFTVESMNFMFEYLRFFSAELLIRFFRWLFIGKSWPVMRLDPKPPCIRPILSLVMT